MDEMTVLAAFSVGVAVGALAMGFMMTVAAGARRGDKQLGIDDERLRTGEYDAPADGVARTPHTTTQGRGGR